MKKLVIRSLIIFSFATIAFTACATPTTPRYIFYHSTASIQQTTKEIKTDFKLTGMFEDYLPFGIIAARDIDNKNSNEYYAIISDAIPYDGSVQDFINSYHVIIKPDKIAELISVIDNSLNEWKIEKKLSEGKNIEFTISQEQNIQQISQNVESWSPNFQFIFKNYSNGATAFVNFGIQKIGATEINYSYYLDYYQTRELKKRLNKALEILEGMGMPKGAVSGTH
jgi:ABC-type cobalt transport system substrate-binding protein